MTDNTDLNLNVRILYGPADGLTEGQKKKLTQKVQRAIIQWARPLPRAVNIALGIGPVPSDAGWIMTPSGWVKAPQ